ncbi:hypothetical protein Nepgr_028035 [Nepenthes gracilis]|uniref:Uncharacterized protein n=1 Tax=Nepenthes gracilis TaxID=150966 RepID=A0AAD3TCV5_NEPGR|nr:hypothetical protein Nepgr_028035 [Nepenthes gracilis]
MKLDNDAGICSPSPPRKSYNPFDSDDDQLDTPAPKDNFNGFDLKSFENNSDSSPFHLRNIGFPWEDHAINADMNGGKNLLGKTETELYTDKNVMECELPEFIFRFKDSSCHSVKDICIDEGVPSQDKKLVESAEDESKDLSALMDLSTHENSELRTLKSSTDDDCQKDEAYQFFDNGSAKMDGLNDEVLGRKYSFVKSGTDDSMKFSEAKHDSAENESVPEWCCAAAELETGNSQKDACNSCMSRLISKDEFNHNVPINEGNYVFGKFGSEENLPKPSVLGCTEEEIKSAETPNGEFPPFSELLEPQESEYGSITSHFNLSILIKEDEKTQNNGSENPPETQIIAQHEEGNLSFVAGIPPTSSITYLGPIAYSGSISLRSESSAGSTRSFAFPVLQTEWNSSPVRMAKADRRHLRKHRGWVEAILCCRF